MATGRNKKDYPAGSLKSGLKEYGAINPDSSDFEYPRKLTLKEQIIMGIDDLENKPDEWELVEE